MSFEEIIGLLMFLIVFADFIRNWDKDDKQKIAAIFRHLTVIF